MGRWNRAADLQERDWGSVIDEVMGIRRISQEKSKKRKKVD